MKNVLFLCVSPISKTAKKTIYSFKQSDGNTVLLDGYQTNEAPTKSVIHKLSKQGSGQLLDQIIIICTDAIKNKVELSDASELKNANIGLSAPIEELTHKDYYAETIDRYSKEINSGYKDHPIDIVEIPMPDFAYGDNSLTEAVVTAAERIILPNEPKGSEVNLFIDFNGGPRTVAFLITALSNLMKLRNVHVKEIMTMNFDNKVNGVVPIQDLSVVFSTYDLISAINEYINYGRIKGLKRFFSDAGNTEINNILKAMENFSNNLQLCRTGYIMDNRRKLASMLNAYKIQDHCGETDTYNRLFRYVVSDIIEGYKGMIDGELPDIIRWCVDRDFIQQALTFASEELPKYFWEYGLYTAGDDELAYFNEYLRKTKSNEFKSLKGKEYPEKEKKYPYCWMIQFLPNSMAEGKSSEEKKPRTYKEIGKLGMTQRAEYSRKDIKTQNRNKISNTITKKFHGYRLEIAKMNTQKLMYCTSQGYSRTICSDDALFKMLLLYYIIKDQRNKTNHADDSDPKDLFKFNELTDCIDELLKSIEEAKRDASVRK